MILSVYTISCLTSQHYLEATFRAENEILTVPLTNIRERELLMHELNRTYMYEIFHLVIPPDRMK